MVKLDLVNTVGRNLPIGNVMKTNLKEIWQGNVMQEIRNSFLENKPKKFVNYVSKMKG